MMKAATCTMICLAVLLVPGLPVHAETGYVSDQLYITLRSEKGQQYDILETLKTDTPLEILQESGDRYLKVRTTDGKTGYVLKQYVTREKPKYMIINRLKKENEAAGQEIRNLKNKLAELQDKLASRGEAYQQELNELRKNTTTLQSQLDESRNNLKELKTRYNDLRQESGNVEDIISERNRLREQRVSLLRKIDTLQTRNNELKNLEMLKWFLAGAGVFLLGWLIGKTPRRKKIKW